MARKKIEVGAGFFNSAEVEEKKESMKDSDTIIQRSYYITRRQYAALKRKAAETIIEDSDQDMSYHVRAALEKYLFADIKKEN